MYRLTSTVKIRCCLDKAFLINIHTNVIVTLSIDAMEYLLSEINGGLRKRDLDDKQKEFIEMIHFLTEKGILEVFPDDI